MTPELVTRGELLQAWSKYYRQRSLPVAIREASENARRTRHLLQVACHKGAPGMRPYIKVMSMALGVHQQLLAVYNRPRAH